MKLPTANLALSLTPHIGPVLPALLEAVLLGIVQGLTEFIPVSSDGHLVLVPYLLGLDPPGLAFEVALHWGTTSALLVFFRRELAAMGRGVLGRDTHTSGRLYRRLALFVVIGSVPVGLVGVLAKDVLEGVFESPLAASVFLFMTAALLFTAERLRDRRIARAPATVPTGRQATAVPGSLPLGVDPSDPTGETLADVGLSQTLLIGVAQVFALLPGWSRSGVTITAGIATGLTREAATRFSFLLGLPALLGAQVVSLGDLAEPGGQSGAEIALGIGASAITGYLAIRFLLRLVARERLTIFAYYCVAAGTVGLLATLLR